MGYSVKCNNSKSNFEYSKLQKDNAKEILLTIINLWRFYADNDDMDWKSLLEAAKIVITDKRVYETAIAVVLFMNFGVFVANYVKKKPSPKVKHTKAAPKTPPAPKPAEGAEEGKEKKGDEKATAAS